VSAFIRAIFLGLVRLVVGAHPVWQGCAPEPRLRIYFANHSSHLDTLTIVAALPPLLRAQTHPVAALDYWGGTALRRFIALECLNAVLVDRNPRAHDPLEPLGDLLKAGRSLIIFPEGTRGEGEVAAFKSGLFHLARRFPEAELVPVYLDNLYRVMPKGSFLPLPLICAPRIGAPLTLGTGETRDAFLGRARAALDGLAQSKRLGLKTEPLAA
jgi:1-acyl-sn-glycerol-3-phosphate acyltransferase